MKKKDNSPKSKEYYNLTYNESTMNTCKHNWEYGIWVMAYDESEFIKGNINIKKNKIGTGYGNNRFIPAQFCTKCGVIRLAPKELNQIKY
jgi:hypothetical protein